MGNLPCVGEKDEAWKQQNKEMVENPAYKFANIAKGGSLIDAYKSGGPLRVVEIAEDEMSSFLYDKEGGRHSITESEFRRWKWKCSQRVAGQDETQKIPDDLLKVDILVDYLNKFTPHDACWDLQKRGGVGETPFHLLCLMDSPVHFEVAKILLKLYPNLALDVYEGEEYYGESALHIAIVIGDLEMVQLLVEAGANVNQRATGKFFLPEDQKKGFTGQTDYEGYAYYGEYPLAFATCLGKMDIYDYLLDHGADPDLQDVFGNSILHMVVISDQAAMYRYAVCHHTRRASTTIKNKENLTPLALACKLARHSIFKEMLELDSIEFWSFSTTLCSAHPLHSLDSVGPDGSTNWNSALMIIVNGEKDDHLEMLDGGVMRQLLIEKWKTFAKKRFMGQLGFTIIHLILFSVSIYTRPMGCALLEYRGPIDAVRFTSEIIVCLNCLAKALYEITEISTQGLNSFVNNCKHAPAQTLYLISCILVLACIPFRFTCRYDVEDVLVILAAPCVWSFMLFFARGYTLTGPFVTMIYKMIVGDLVRFGIIYVIFLAGFTQGFYFLFKDVPEDTENEDLAKFSTIPETILKLYQMTFGEFKYDVFNLSQYSPLTKIIFALFMILVPILLLNMLIAMMGNTHTKIISKSTKEWWKQWAKIVVVLERGVSKKNRLEYQKAYSVRLAGAPPPPDSSPPPQEQRALVVIRMATKSRARKRKDAVFRWKALSKEIIRQLRRKKYARRPFQLKESLKKGQLLNEERPDLLLTSTITQLAWEKDIDLTKGHTFVPEKDSICSCSSSHPSGDLSQVPLCLSPTTKSLKQVKYSLSNEKNYEIALTSSKKKKRKMLYNRVYPLLSNETRKEETSISESSSYFFSNTSESDISNSISLNHSAVKAHGSLFSQVCATCGGFIKSYEPLDRIFPVTSKIYTNNTTEENLTRELGKSNELQHQKRVSAIDWSENCSFNQHESCQFGHNARCHLNHHESCQFIHEICKLNHNHNEICQLYLHERCQVIHHERCIFNNHESCTVSHNAGCKIIHLESCHVNHNESCKRNHIESCQINHHELCKLNHHEHCEVNHHVNCKLNHHNIYNANHHEHHNFSPEISSSSSAAIETYSTDELTILKTDKMDSNFAVLPEIHPVTTSHWFEHNPITNFARKKTRKKEMKTKYFRRKK